MQIWKTIRFSGLVMLAVAAIVPITASSAAPGLRAATSSSATQKDEAQAGTHTVTDEIGHRVLLPAEIHRIVSIAPNLTETVYALGAGPLLVADTNYCDAPPEARLKPHIGMPLNPSLEAIVAMKPDLILATTAINRLETVDSLEQVGLPVYSTDPRSVDGLLQGIAKLSEVIGVGQRGHQMVDGLKERLRTLDGIIQGEAPRRVLFVVWESPLISIGPKTFIADALTHAGAESVIKSKQDWPNVTPEEVVRLRPDYLVYAAAHGDQAPSLDLLRQRRGWKDLPAVREGHLVVISDEIDRPAPGLIDAIEELARKLHPSLFSAERVPGAGN